MEKIKYWILTVSRGYSLPMSFLNWLVVFLLCAKLGGNIFYGLLALVGICTAHLGTNLFDDCVDFLLKSPKQKCKTAYLENGFTNIKTVFIVTVIYFLIAGSIGLFFIINCGLPVLYLSILAAIIIIFYPRLNHFALGEFAVGLTFGLLLFAGIEFVMLNYFNLKILLISIPISLLTVAVVYTHALMDFDFDLKSGKKTLCILLGSKKNSLIGLMAIYFITFAIHIILVIKNILPVCTLSVLLILPMIYNLFINMNKYINSTSHNNDDFMINFIIARNINLFYNILIITCIIL